MVRLKGVAMRQIAVREDTSEEDHASDVEDTEQGTQSESDLSMQDDGPSSDEEMEESVAEDMEKFHSTFKGIGDRYRLINRIGEGIISHSWLRVRPFTVI